MAELHLLPTLWFRDDWSSWIAESNRAAEKPNLEQIQAPAGTSAVAAQHSLLGEFLLSCEGEVPLLFTENETNSERLFGQKNESPYVKDGINNCVVQGNQGAVNPGKQGTKVAAHYRVTIAPGESATVRLRLTSKSGTPETSLSCFGTEFDQILAVRLQEADEFYRSVTPSSVSADAANVMRQAVAGMLWSKQFFFFDGDNWLDEHHSNPLHSGYHNARNSEWFHMLNEDIISMPDKWEYPWYAAWDLAFHTLPLSIVDPDFAKEQLKLMLRNVYLHPSGQMPAYEWNFSDVNPPVHAFATLFLHRTEQALRSETDLNFLTQAFNKLLLNFTWWVNRKDRFGKNVFEGGFLGLDNIGVFDRSAPLPTGGHLEQSDGTSWMAMFCLNMLAIALELAKEDPAYEDVASKFFEHFVSIARAMSDVGKKGISLWDDEDGFFYDVLQLPNGDEHFMKIRSMVGLIPLFAVETLEPEVIDKLPGFKRRMQWFIDNHTGLPEHLESTQRSARGVRRLLSLVNRKQLTRVLARMLDEAEFLSPHGIRALSRYHKDVPYEVEVNDHVSRGDYEPAESSTGIFGGNSNWRGPVWFPVNYLLVESLQKFHHYYGADFKVECPTGSKNEADLWQVAAEISRRLVHIFLRGADGRRAVAGGEEIFQSDPHWKDYLQFYEYFHGDNGAGIGANHQTGWTGLVAKLLEQSGE